MSAGVKAVNTIISFINNLDEYNHTILSGSCHFKDPRCPGGTRGGRKGQWVNAEELDSDAISVLAQTTLRWSKMANRLLPATWRTSQHGGVCSAAMTARRCSSRLVIRAMPRLARGRLGLNTSSEADTTGTNKYYFPIPLKCLNFISMLASLFWQSG